MFQIFRSATQILNFSYFTQYKAKVNFRFTKTESYSKKNTYDN